MQIKFDGLVELGTALMQLDGATEKEVRIGNSEDNVLAKNYKAIVNDRTGEPSCIPSKRYNLLKHQEAFGEVVDILKGINMSVFGTLHNYGDKVAVEMAFKGNNIEVNGDELKIGMRIVNSYNLQTGFNGEVFAYRSACSNGMFLGKVLGEAKMRRYHTGTADVRKLVSEFIKDIVNGNDKLKTFVNFAMEDSYEWELSHKILEQVIEVKKYRKLLFEHLEENHTVGAELTRWDVYNALTSIATHGLDLKASAIDYLQNKAQKILVTEMELMPEIQAEA